MAELVWRELLRQHMVRADLPLREADAGLQFVSNVFQSADLTPEAAAPGSAARVAWLRAKFVLAMDRLTEVTRNLSYAAVHMEAARVHALHGGNPTSPLPSIQFLAQAGTAGHAAIGQLIVSRVMAEYACRIVGWGRHHLLRAIAFVDAAAPGLPDQLAFVDPEYFAAIKALTTAMQMTHSAVGDFAEARQFLAPY